MRNGRGSSIALVLAGVLFLLASVAGFLNANVVNGPRFADHVNAMRTDPQLAAQIGAQISSALVDAQPDLVAIAPLYSRPRLQWWPAAHSTGCSHKRWRLSTAP